MFVVAVGREVSNWSIMYGWFVLGTVHIFGSSHPHPLSIIMRRVIRSERSIRTSHNPTPLPPNSIRRRSPSCRGFCQECKTISPETIRCIFFVFCIIVSCRKPSTTSNNGTVSFSGCTSSLPPRGELSRCFVFTIGDFVKINAVVITRGCNLFRGWSAD